MAGEKSDFEVNASNWLEANSSSYSVTLFRELAQVDGDVKHLLQHHPLFQKDHYYGITIRSLLMLSQAVSFAVMKEYATKRNVYHKSKWPRSKLGDPYSSTKKEAYTNKVVKKFLSELKNYKLGKGHLRKKEKEQNYAFQKIFKAKKQRESNSTYC